MQALDMLRPVDGDEIPKMTIEEEIRLYRRAAIRAHDREDHLVAKRCLVMVELLTLRQRKRR